MIRHGNARAGFRLALAIAVFLTGCYPYLTPPAPLLQFQESGDVYVAAGASGVWIHLPEPDAYAGTVGYAVNDDIAIVGSGHVAQGARQLGGEVAVLGYRSQQITRKARRFSTFGGQVGFGGLNRVSTDDPALASYQADVTHTEMSAWVGSIGGQYAYGTDWNWIAVGTTWRGNFVYVDYSRYRYGGVETGHGQDMAVILDSSFHVEFGPPVIRAGLLFGANAPIPFGIPPDGPVFAPMSAQTYLGITASSRF